MISTTPPSNPAIGALWACVAAIAFSLNDMAFKFLSGDYALHQLVFTRSLVGLLIVAFIVAPLTGGLGQFRTNHLGTHVLRGLCVVLANMFFFMGLAAVPLAEATAIYFVAPFVIALFSIVFLGEQVGPRRWMAITVGLVGVLLVIRPGTEAFQIAALLPIAAAVAYASLHMFTRKMRGTETAVTMAFYIQLIFTLTSLCFGLAFGHGGFEGNGHPSVEFLLRAWKWPPASDLGIMCLLGLNIAGGGIAISQAYRVSEAALVAPFEYVGMPMAIALGIVIFGEWPVPLAWAGMVLIMGSGLIFIWRETVTGGVIHRPRIRR